MFYGILLTVAGFSAGSTLPRRGRRSRQREPHCLENVVNTLGGCQGRPEANALGGFVQSTGQKVARRKPGPVLRLWETTVVAQVGASLSCLIISVAITVGVVRVRMAPAAAVHAAASDHHAGALWALPSPCHSGLETSSNLTADGATCSELSENDQLRSRNVTELRRQSRQLRDTCRGFSTFSTQPAVDCSPYHLGLE